MTENEKLRAVLLEVLEDYDHFESITPAVWRKACNALGVDLDLKPLK